MKIEFIQSSLIRIPPNRQRQEFNPDAMLDLEDSIQSIGLLNPIVVREELVEGLREVVLVAGERRLRALSNLHTLGVPLRFAGEPIPEGTIPISNLKELSLLAAEEAELDENLRRSDLTWQERDVAIAKLHRLRTQQFPSHTIADTADEVYGRGEGAPRENVRRSLLVAKHLDNPAIAKAKSTEEALKILKRNESTQKNIALAETLGLTFSSKSHRIINGDCVDWMLEQPPEQFDVILTDPPYGMGADTFGDGAGNLSSSSHTYDDSFLSWSVLMNRLVPALTRAARPQSHLYLFCDIDRFHILRQLFSEAGWWVHRTPMINHKPTGRRMPWPEHGPFRHWEMLLYAVRGKRPVIGAHSDVISTRLTEETYGHGAQKPVELYTNLLARSCRPGDRVFDPFAGTGTIFPAAHSLKLLATGIELDLSYYGVCLKRIGELDENH